MMKNHEKRRPTAFRSIAVRVICLALALWLVAIGLLTWAVAEDFYHQVEDLAYRTAGSAANTIKKLADGSYDEISMIQNLRYPYYRFHFDSLLPIVVEPQPTHSSDDWIYEKWDLRYGYEAAAAYYDTNGQPLIQCGNYVIFEYITEESWKNEIVEPEGQIYVNLDEIEGGIDALGGYASDIRHRFPSFGYLFRIHGYYEGQQFHPTKIEKEEHISYLSSRKQVNYLDNHRYNQLQWETLLELEEEPTQEIHTLYVWDIDGVRYNSRSVTVNGTEFDTLAQLLQTAYGNSQNYSKKSLLETVITTTTWSETGVGVATIRCWPLGYAAFRLIPAYLVSLVVVALAVWLILRKIHRNLTAPLLDLATNRNAQPSGWWESYEIGKRLSETRQTLTETSTQLKQTRTALDYAHHAEENRKQLISNLTHELKTPLAIIHSYAEGLQAGIAEDKMDQYLSVILEQSERMDALVLQMLDLSRLEAGKVRLTMEPVALLKLTKNITDRFAPLVEKKELTLRYDLIEDLTVPADEGRIEQVLTNLVSNAVKYTPAGGEIWVNIYSHGEKIHFFIGNTAPHLSEEALEKIWDSFYRADPSRTEPGTGLGLALVKGIVQLHRGECSVRNSTSINGESAVEFGFTLPMT